jgi:acyl-CoA hydrolase
MTLRSSQTVPLAEMPFAHETHPGGALFGGHALRLMDGAVLVATPCSSRCTLVTPCSERPGFKEAVKVGHLIKLNGSVFTTGRSSMTESVSLLGADCTPKLDLRSLPWMKKEKPVALRSFTIEGPKEN